MNKKILLSLIVIFVILVAVTVGLVFNRRRNNYAKNELDLETMKFIDDTNVSMRIKEGSLTRTSATIVIEDKSKSDTFGTGEPYTIEKKEDGKWKELDPLEPVAWIEIWYTSREDGSFSKEEEERVTNNFQNFNAQKGAYL